VHKLIGVMSCDEILEMDKYYDDNGVEHHELKEIIDFVLSIGQ